jgi:tagatose 1,6-diphosphate aldolase
MSAVGLGTWRALQRAATPNDIFTVLAIDHQDALRRAMRPQSPAGLHTDQLTAFKLAVLQALAPEASAVLLDPVLSAAQAIAQGLTRRLGLLVELEKADYDLKPLPRAVEIHAAWSATKIKRMGADGVKLFFYYHPDDRPNAAVQEALLSHVASECRVLDIPLYAEPILYDAAPNDLTTLVVESARRTEACGATVLKLEFPAPSTPDAEGNWPAACEAVTNAVNVPWVLLSAGVDFETFARQVEIACKAGASGFIAGRAVWGDAASIDDANIRQSALEGAVRDRFRRLSDIAGQFARPFSAVLPTPAPDLDWFKNYASL